VDLLAESESMVPAREDILDEKRNLLAGRKDELELNKRRALTFLKDRE
jgi:hypothetical protein